MEKKKISASLGLIHLIAAIENRDRYLFHINGEPHKVIVHGLEAVDEHPGTYDISVTIIDLNVPHRQHFRFSPATGQGEWIGTLSMDHKAYADHAISPEEQEIEKNIDFALRGKLA